jgi:high affinity Mn2+ porin
MLAARFRQLTARGLSPLKLHSLVGCSVSLTATAFMTLRLNNDFDVVLNPEIAGGEGFGDVTGIAGFTNGETPRVLKANPKLYLSRGYLRSTWDLGSGKEFVEGCPNHHAGE